MNMKIINDQTLNLISPADALELAQELLTIQEDEKEVQAAHEGTVSEYEYSSKQWDDIIKKPSLEMI